LQDDLRQEQAALAAAKADAARLQQRLEELQQQHATLQAQVKVRWINLAAAAAAPAVRTHPNAADFIKQLANRFFTCSSHAFHEFGIVSVPKHSGAPSHQPS
jgi:hypothetical protein